MENVCLWPGDGFAEPAPDMVVLLEDGRLSQLPMGLLSLGGLGWKVMVVVGRKVRTMHAAFALLEDQQT